MYPKSTKLLKSLKILAFKIFRRTKQIIQLRGKIPKLIQPTRGTIRDVPWKHGISVGAYSIDRDDGASMARNLHASDR